ncbi:MAG TPA: hypothetical protein VIT91_05935 [Chthoniobacterales bacterium]
MNSHECAVCTLFEGHYHLGAAALINSLYASGYRGRVICGVRGSLPSWADPIRIVENEIRATHFGEGFEVCFVPLATTMHLTNYKPTFLLDVWNKLATGASKIYYIDPDVVVKCRWEVIDRWAEGGLALCEDVHPNLPTRHPFRLSWKEWLAKHGFAVAEPGRDKYYSGGFIGIPLECRDFLKIWSNVIAEADLACGSLSALKQGDPTSLFHSADQDAMNMALMTSPAAVNATGREGMDFETGGHLLSHAIGTPKPWQGQHIWEALRGYPPAAASKQYLQHLATPIRVFNQRTKFFLSASLKIAAIIGRFYRRA